jgi:abortive infection bacteriophage resistance protein
MKFTKPALTLDQQVALLISRGMDGDPKRMRRRLAAVNYYRLSAYWFTFRAENGQFHPGTNFETVWERYAFDRELRLLVLDALERIEVAVRARLTYEHTAQGDPFTYVSDPEALFARDAKKREDFLNRLRDDLDRSHEPFVKHFQGRYGEAHAWPPVWVTAEVLSFGGILSFFRGSPRAIQRAVADHFGVADAVFESWLLSLNVVRNICAHHGRLWNRDLGLAPKIPRPDRSPEWHEPVKIANDRAFAVLTILTHCLHRIAPGSGWARRFAELLVKHPTIPITQMGIPANWQDCPVWKRMMGVKDC